MPVVRGTGGLAVAGAVLDLPESAGMKIAYLHAEEITALLKEGLNALQPLEGSIQRPALPDQSKSLAQRMYGHGYFYNRELWAAMERCNIYTQKAHYEAVKAMEPLNVYPSVPGQGDVVPHHCRDSANSGTGAKPPDWFCIPIYASHHDHLHAHATREERQKHIQAAIEITADCMANAVKQFLGRDTLSGITIEELADFEKMLGINSGFTHGHAPHRRYAPT